MRWIPLLLVAFAPCFADEPAQTAQPVARWSADKANAWYAKQAWLTGCNFIPSTAITRWAT